MVVDHPDWTFAQIAKWISQEWKQIDADEKDELQKEAEEMNELGIRKLPRDDDAPDPDKDTTDEDSDFEEGYRRKQKPKVRVKREAGEDGPDEVGGGLSGGEGTSESDWEPEADIMPKERDTTRSGRQRKRPSFFQEFESQENNLDTILQEFEQTQAAEFGKPRLPKPPPKPASERKPRKKRAQVSAVEPEPVAVEVETLRSGRTRKVRRVMNSFLDDEDEDDRLLRGASSDDDDFEPPPEDEIEKLEDQDDAIAGSDDDVIDDAASEDLEDSEDERLGMGRSRDMMALPIKKRGRPKKILTDYEIEEATRAAMYTRPSIEITRVPRVFSAEGLAISKDVVIDLIILAVERVEGPDPARFVAKKSAPTDVLESEVDESPKFQWVNESLDVEEEHTTKAFNTEKSDDKELSFNPLDEGDPLDRNPLGDDELDRSTDNVKDTVNEEEALLETVSAATVRPPFVNECEDEPDTETPMNDSETVESDNPLGSVDYPVGESADNDKESDPFSDVASEVTNKPLDARPPEGPPLTEEDLLTGPAHNLDDSQYKADYVDPNLEDIFK